jgi:hypothetical protein
MWRALIPVLSLAVAGCHLVFPHETGPLDRGPAPESRLDRAGLDPGSDRDRPQSDAPSADGPRDAKPADVKKLLDLKPAADVNDPFDLKPDQKPKADLKVDQKPAASDTGPACGVSLDDDNTISTTSNPAQVAVPARLAANLLLVHVATTASSVTVKLDSTLLTMLCQKQGVNGVTVGIFAGDFPGGISGGTLKVTFLPPAQVIAVVSTWLNAKNNATLCVAPTFGESGSPTLTAMVPPLPAGSPTSRRSRLAQARLRSRARKPSAPPALVPSRQRLANGPSLQRPP